MPWTENLPEWNATGTAPPQSKKDSGWEAEEKPPAGWFNWFFNRAYKCLKEIREFVSALAGEEYAGETVAGNAGNITAVVLALGGHVDDDEESVHGSASAATPETLIHRDAAGRAQVADPSHASDIATKGYVDGAPRTRVAVLTAAGAIPALTNGAEKKQVEGANHDYFICAFDKDADEHIFFHFVVPPDYQAGNIAVKLRWIAPTKTSGAVVWNLTTLGRESGEAWDTTLGVTQAKTQTTAATAKRLNVAVFSAFNPGWAAGDTVIVKISRDADNASDTLDEDAHFLMASIEYTGR
jgi:hypothetical protein